MLSGITPPLSAFGDGRIIVRDEKLEEEEVAVGGIEKEGMMMLLKMLAEQPPAPMTLTDMFYGQLNYPNLTSYNDFPLERSHLTPPPPPPLNGETDG